MVEREGGRQEREERLRRVSYKQLRLITPEWANELGIVTESPVFLSPQISGPSQCAECGVEYTPLTYQVGEVTTSQHFHKLEGGIYFWELQYRQQKGDTAREKLYPSRLPIPEWPTGFLAFLQPMGATDGLDDGNTVHVARSEAVRVTRIVAHPFNTLSLPRTIYGEGALVLLDPDDEVLYPVPLSRASGKEVWFSIHTLENGSWWGTTVKTRRGCICRVRQPVVKSCRTFIRIGRPIWPDDVNTLPTEQALALVSVSQLHSSWRRLLGSRLRLVA